MNRSLNDNSKGFVSDEDEEPLRELVNPGRNTCISYPSKTVDQIKELCIANGINYEKVKKGSVKNIKKLEMFFSGFPKLQGMELFPALQSLTLIGQEIEVLENLTELVHLVELNVSECAVQNISGLENCTNLKKLFLYDNKITKIENISHLTKLKILWLNTNDIQEIEGLDKLTLLTDLNLADNSISCIGHSLDNNINLEVLDLSANKLTSFKDLTHLSHLRKLHCLSLKNAVYGPNPVALLCNYATYLLFHLPDLQRLDTYDVDNKHLKELAESTVLKKKMYYNMRVKTLQRNTADLQSRLAQERDELQLPANARIHALYSSIKEIEREREEQTIEKGKENVNEEKDEKNDSEKEEGEELSLEQRKKQGEQKKEALMGRMEKWEKQNLEIEACYKESCEQVQLVSELTIQRLIVELETSGNVRFEDGKSTDVWYKSCHDLVTSRFCAGDYTNFGIIGLKIHRITRVYNRILRTKFDETLDQKLDQDDIINITKGRSHKKLLEYLFFMWNPNIFDESNEPITVLENGFRKATDYENAWQDGGVPLSNSVGVCDESRIQYCIKKSKERGSTNPCPFRHGQLIITKAFIGKAVVANAGDKRITRSRYPGADSVFRPRSHENCEPKTISGITKPVKPCDCSSRQCAWFMFDESMVLPEYVVDFEYVTKIKSKSPYIHYSGDTTSKDSIEDNSSSVDDDVLNMEPKARPRPRLIALTEDLLLSHCKLDSLQNLTVLNLHGNGLSRLKHINTITQLKKLIVSFNELIKLDELNHMLFLEYLDVSFNKLSTLEGIKGCNRLKYLDISWNKLKYTREELGIMRKHMISLVTLDTRNNPWQKPETLRMRALGRLKNLELLDGESVTADEVATSLRMAAASRISTFAILAHSRTDQVKPHSLSLYPTAQTILATSNQKPARPLDDDSQWMGKVTTLNLDNLHLGKLSNLEKLVNLRWASFNNNDLTKIEGFDGCNMLQELSLEGNCISKFEGLTRNHKLRWLNLRSNNVVNLDTGMLERLPELWHLSIENNCIKSLRGLQHSLEMQELYIGNNEITNIREIFTIKVISTLVILDLCGNPLVDKTTNYRLFVIYHLTTLKALDGLAVEPSEGGIAKDTFGGRMTTDFIAERLGHSNFMEMRELDFPNCSLRTVDLGSGDLFLNLRSVNLEHNSLTSFGGLVNLVNLKVLCLNHNHIETIVTKSKAFSPASKRPGDQTMDFTDPESYTPVLINLEVLHLGYNGISNLALLQLSRLPNLKALFLQGNEISKVEGLEGLRELREVVLDRNKIKSLSEYSFINQWNLVELHMEENRLRGLSHIECLQNLQRLYIGMNRIQDFVELEKLEPLSNLIELSVINNAVTRRLLHRPTLVFRMPGLLCIDGIPVSNEERTKAEVYFLEQQGGMQSNGAIDAGLPGIAVTARQSHAPLRVTTMHLSNSDRTWNAGSRQDFTSTYVVNGDSRDSSNKGRRVSNNRGASSNSQQNLATSDSFTYDRRSHSNSNIPTSQSFTKNSSGNISYIPHGFSYPTYPCANEDRSKGNQKHK